MTANEEVADHLFDADGAVADFVFDDRVAHVFDDMLERSVPFYSEVQRQVTEMAHHFLATGGVVYDIGCSTGTTLISISNAVGPDQPLRCIGLEPSPGMREQAQAKFNATPQPERFELSDSAVEDAESLPDATMVTMLYTLQFIRPIHRAAVINMIQESLQPGGALILAEKVLCEDSGLRRLYIDLYHDLKRRQGYTSTEISRKREALENVLIPFTHNENVRLLREAGFAEVESFFRWYNFAGYIGVKA